MGELVILLGVGNLTASGDRKNVDIDATRDGLARQVIDVYLIASCKSNGEYLFGNKWFMAILIRDFKYREHLNLFCLCGLDIYGLVDFRLLKYRELRGSTENP